MAIGLVLQDTEEEQLLAFPNGSNCKGWECSLNQLCAARSAVAAINADSSVLPNIWLNLTTFNSNCHRKGGTEAALNIIAVNHLKAVVGPLSMISKHNHLRWVLAGPMCSTVAVGMSTILSHAQIPYMSHAASAVQLSDKSVFPWFLRTVCHRYITQSWPEFDTVHAHSVQSQILKQP